RPAACRASILLCQMHWWAFCAYVMRRLLRPPSFWVIFFRSISSGRRGNGLALGQRQHGAPAIGRTAQAAVLFAQLFGLAAFNHQRVVKIQFFAFGNVAQAVDEES